MNRKCKSLETVLIIVGTALALLLFAQGCAKKEEPVAQPPMPKPSASEPAMGQTQSETLAGAAKETAAAAKDTVMAAGEQMAAAIEQKICPVMEGNPINPDIFVEYKGKKVYFCCNGCQEKFLADPEKYISKLPQFQP